MQISIEELRLALTFLKEQLGEDEVISLLNQLHVEGTPGASSGVEVAKLIQMALKQEDEENVKAENE